MKSHKGGVVILLVDDDENFPLLLAREKFSFSLHFVFDGEQAIQYLSGKGKYADRVKYPFPHGLLLDLHMPASTALNFSNGKGSRPNSSHCPLWCGRHQNWLWTKTKHYLWVPVLTSASPWTSRSW